MSKQYITTIMDRVYLGGNNFIYYPSHTAIGDYDEKNGLFIDRDGQSYFCYLDKSLLQSEITKGFSQVFELKDIPRLVGVDNMREAISEYTYLCSQTSYYVSYTSKNQVFTIPLNFEDIKAKADFSTQTKVKAPIKKVVEQEQPKEPVRTEEHKYGIFSDELANDVRIALAHFFEELTKGSYSLDDLKDLRTLIDEQKEELVSLIDSIDLQIEASEFDESSIKLRDEDKIQKKQRPKEATIIQMPKKENKPLKPKNYIDIVGLFNKITKSLIAQDEPLRRVLVELARKEQSDLNNDRGLLITGSTGTGKTYMMELIARYLDRPIIIVDSTQLTMPGYVGKNIEEVLWELYEKCGKDIKKTERAIVYFKEIDKKGSDNKDDVSGKGVLNVLLPFFDGSTYDACDDVKLKRQTVKINTKNMIIILDGAFEDVYKNLKSHRNIGFTSSSKEFKTNRQAETQDFIDNAKMPAEFMGRVAIVKLNDLELDDIKRILTDGSESALRVQEQLFKELGVKLTANEGYIEAIAKQAIDRKTGARGLNTAVDETTWEAYGDVYTHLGEYEEIILGKETVEDPKQYTKIPKKK